MVHFSSWFVTVISGWGITRVWWKLQGRAEDQSRCYSQTEGHCQGYPANAPAFLGQKLKHYFPICLAPLQLGPSSWTQVPLAIQAHRLSCLSNPVASFVKFVLLISIPSPWSSEIPWLCLYYLVHGRATMACMRWQPKGYCCSCQFLAHIPSPATYSCEQELNKINSLWPSIYSSLIYKIIVSTCYFSCTCSHVPLWEVSLTLPVLREYTCYSVPLTCFSFNIYDHLTFYHGFACQYWNWEFWRFPWKCVLFSVLLMYRPWPSQLL